MAQLHATGPGANDRQVSQLHSTTPSDAENIWTVRGGFGLQRSGRTHPASVACPRNSFTKRSLALSPPFLCHLLQMTPPPSSTPNCHSVPQQPAKLEQLETPPPPNWTPSFPNLPFKQMRFQRTLLFVTRLTPPD